MPADHDDTIDDGVLKQVIAELRRPVRLDPAVDQQVLDLIRSESPAASAPGTPRRWGTWLAGAAIAAGVLLTVVLPDGRRPATDPASAAVVERTAASADARPVRLRLAAPTSSRVVVVGDFNDWDPAATPLRLTGDGGTWMVELRLKPGRYHYTFLIDGRRWERDPSEPPAAESDFGPPVSVLTVG